MQVGLHPQSQSYINWIWCQPCLVCYNWNNGYERFGEVNSELKFLPVPRLPKKFKGYIM